MSKKVTAIRVCRGCGESFDSRGVQQWCRTCRTKAEAVAHQLGTSVRYVLTTYADPIGKVRTHADPIGEDE